MRTYPLFFIIALLFWSCGQSKDPNKSEKTMEAEKQAIREVIANETAAFFARDYEAWKSNFAQTEYAFQAWSNDDGTFDSNVGWEDINKHIGKYIEENPEPLSSHPIVERKNMQFKFYGSQVAYLTWDQFNSDQNEKNFHHSKEVRLMEKIDGRWKIVCVSAFWDYKNLIPAEKLPMIQKIANESGGTKKI
ncbi:hypothetical protein CLV98_11765 [Dyadobacter jejuensis]|uniref:SnoaL-like protein n=1 Tax=Dyadobacter jejuensis TaxID=1082580 RepID=A0A316AWI9_9BACT|nr:hypothetical protein [Dyadobacter jejuensis]PWJ54527.1 hypothetical protein CLV98_11765 [Dyadobacter jejuensis]